MTDYAIVRDGEIQRFADEHDVQRLSVGPDPDHPEKPYLLPIELTDPAFNPVAEVKEDPVNEVLEDRVTRVFNVRAKNASEINQMKTDKIAELHEVGDGRMNALVLPHQQITTLVGLIDLLYLHTDTSSWSSGDQERLVELTERLEHMEYVRGTEETKMNEIEALTDPTEIDEYDLEAGW